MPFGTIKLNDGREIPEIGFGTWKIPQDVTSQQVQQGIEVGFDHVDTAQVGQDFSRITFFADGCDCRSTGMRSKRVRAFGIPG